MLRRPFFPFVLAVYPVLFVFAHNRGLLSGPEIALPLLLSLGLAALIFAATLAWQRETVRAATGTAIVLVLFYGHALLRSVCETALRVAGAEGADLPATIAWGLVLLGTLAAFGALAKRHADTLAAMVPIFNVSALALMLQAGLPLIGAAPPPDSPETTSAESGGYAASAASHPDIYYIVLDGYGSSEALRDVFGFDNRPFIRILEARGFYVAPDSRANYLRTIHSLFASLNMAYVAPGVAHHASRPGDLGPLVAGLRDNEVMRQLRAHGYTIYSFETGYAATELESQTRRLVGRAGPNEFETTLLNLTPLPPLLALLPELDAYEAHRRRIRFTLETLPKLALEPGPKFVFAHILAPHPPFVFDAEGGAVENRLPFQYYDGRHFIVRQSRREYLEGYAGQARFISGQILLAIDGILAASATPPIVVLQGDHGPGAGFYHEDLAASDVVERGFILNAFLLPEPAESIGLDPAITPVNTFRIILGRYLDMDLPLLPDRSFYNRESRPYAFSEITDTLARQIDARRAARGEGADGGTPDALTQ